MGAKILWAACSGVALGVFLRSMIALPDYAPIFLIGLAFLAVVLSANNSQRLRLALVMAAAIFAFGAGILRMQSAILIGDPMLDSEIGEKIELEGIVSDEPDARATQVRVPVRIISIQDTSPSTGSGQVPVHAQVLAIFPAHTELYYGERVQISGTLELPQSFDAGAGRQFNYPGYLAVQGISYELDRAKLISGGEFAGNSMVSLSYKIKEMFVVGLARSLPEPHAGLAGGITVGDKRAMGKDLSQEFRTVSLIHIVVLSGYNITIVISALFRILNGAPRFIRFGAGGFVALFFAVMTGFASASLRAALMALIAISGTLSGRIYRADRALALICALMLLWNPYLLAFDPGFQLSFLACAGLLVFTPIFSKLFVRIPDTFGLKEILISTSSAQLAVLPLLLYESGTLSLVSLPANLLVLVAVPPAMLFSAVAAVGGLVAEPLAPFIGFPALALLSYILNTAHALASIPFAAIQVPAFSAWLLVPMYAGIFGYGLYKIRASKEKAAS